MKAALTEINKHLAESFVGTLANHLGPALPLLRSVLIITALVAITYALFSKKGSKSWIFGLACILIYFLLGIGAGITSALTFILSLIAGILMFVELIIPGFGICGISGIILFIVSIALSMSGGTQAVITLLIAGILVALVAKCFVERGEEMAFFRQFISFDVAAKRKAIGLEIGEKGRTSTPLRPTGTCDFEGHLMTVQSSGKFIEKGKEVTIVSIQGHHIYVDEE